MRAIHVEIFHETFDLGVALKVVVSSDKNVMYLLLAYQYWLGRGICNA